MRRFSTASRLALTSSTVAIAAGLSAAPAEAAQVTTQSATPTTTVAAQDVQTLPTNSTNPADVIPQTAAASRAAGPGITVTGSRIRRPNLESVVPVTSIQGEQFFQKGNTSVGDQLNDLPQLRSTFAGQNPGLGIGIAGLNLLDLRGLGPKRTLVLVNGRRHVAADITNNASNPDVNTIPNDLIDRVDIVTGGNSAVYGSDAVAGVVNFILKRDFNGIQVRAQGAEAGAGFGTNYLGSVMFGHNFGDGKGNITLEGEYTHQDRIFASEIPWLARSFDSFAVVDVDTGGLPHGSDGFPDRTYFTDLRVANSHFNGLVPINYTTATAQCGIGLSASNGPPANNGTPYNCTYIFQPDGSLVQQTGTRFGTGPTPTIIGGNGITGREAELVSVFPRNDRINLNLLGHYTVSEAFEPFVEAKYSRQIILGNNAGPSAITGNFTQFDIRERIRLDNPFLTPAERTQIASLLVASGCAPSTTTACTAGNFAQKGGPGTGSALQTVTGPLTGGDIALINSGAYRFVTARVLTDVGNRDEHFTRNTYRGVVGARGTFNTDWSYEVSANYGQFDETGHKHGYVDKTRLMLALDAGRDPATGTIKCRAQFDATAAIPYTTGMTPADAAAAQARLAADIAACVPYNPFGAANNAAAARYVEFQGTTRARLSQLDLLGFMNGDTSQLFELPGGPVSFVIGGEYRRETARYLDDPFIKSEGTNNVIIGDFQPPAFHVAEAFGELNVPILKDMPFFHELSVSGAGRFSKYGRAVGNVWTYNVGGEWAPVRDIRFRANYGKAVRAPNVSETAFPQVPNFAPGFLDPCASAQIANNPNRQSNCAAALSATILANLPSAPYSLGVISGSNPLLTPEVSKSLTVGAVLQPRFIPGFSASVDYYNIKVNKVIVALAAQQIANLCYDQPSLDNAYCGLFTRWMGPGSGSFGESVGQIQFNTLIQAGVNFAKRIRRGVDFNANYRTRLGGKVTLDTSLIWVHAIKSSNYENPALPNFENRILSELGDPSDEGRLDVDLKVGNVTFGYSGHYIAPMYLNLAEDFATLPAACTAAGCPPNNADWADVHKYPAISYHNIRIQWDTGPAFNLKNIQLYAGVDNIFDRHAPFGLSATGTLGTDRGTGNAAIYDYRGRAFYAGIKARY
jgi:outer membrane receptor protein involved in Fe transport